jgi:hypothetical protein
VLHVEVDFSGFPFFAGFTEECGNQTEEGGFVGKARRLSSWLMRSSALEGRRRAQCAGGRAKTAKPWGKFSFYQAARLRAESAYMAKISLRRVVGRREGWRKGRCCG